jgi:transposase
MRTDDQRWSSSGTFRDLGRRSTTDDAAASALEVVFAEDGHAPVDVTWLVYQQIISAYAHRPRGGGKPLAPVIDGLRRRSRPGSTNSPHWGRPAAAPRRRAGLLHPPRLTGPTEANGRLDALRRDALGFRNLLNDRISPYCTAAHSHSESGRAH